jgi:hypothetical protein
MEWVSGLTFTGGLIAAFCCDTLLMSCAFFLFPRPCFLALLRLMYDISRFSHAESKFEWKFVNSLAVLRRGCSRAFLHATDLVGNVVQSSH